MSTIDVYREVYTNIAHPTTSDPESQQLHNNENPGRTNESLGPNQIANPTHNEADNYKHLQSEATKKRKKRNEDDEYLKWNEELMRHVLPSEMEADFVASVFEIGLRNSSPKVLMQLMPLTNQLTTEHIKSHLQKYRLHYSRSKEEFLQYYDSHLKRDFEDFVRQEGWRNTEALLARAQNSRESGEGEESDASEVPEAQQPSLVSNLDDVPIEVIQELNDKIVHEQMQLQATLQHHIMVQTRLQKAMHDQLKKLRAETAAGAPGQPPPQPHAVGPPHHSSPHSHHHQVHAHHPQVQVDLAAQGVGGAPPHLADHGMHTDNQRQPETQG